MANIIELVIDVDGATAVRRIDRVSDATTRLGRAGTRASSHMAKLGRVLGGALKVGIGAAVAGFVGLTGVIGKGVNMAMTLEQTMADTAAVFGKSVAEVQPLKKLIEDLGLDPTLKVNAQEAGVAINMLARNGLTLDEILQGAAKSTILLANATNADFGTAADIATDVMSLFNIEAAEMSKAVNGITSVVNNSKFSIDDYRLAVAQGGGVAATVGVAFDDFNTSIAAIAPLFSGGSDAGTSFKVMLQRLVPKSKPASAKMQALGIITKEAGNRFFDSAGNMKTMAEIAGVLQGALSGLSDEQTNSALSVIFGTDAMRAAAGMARVGEAGFRQLQATMGNTSATDAAATRMGTLAGKLDILRGVIDALWSQIGGLFIPVITELAQKLTVLVSQNSEAILGFFRGMVRHVESFAMTLISVGPKVFQFFGLFFGTLNDLRKLFLAFHSDGRNVLMNFSKLAQFLGMSQDAALKLTKQVWLMSKGWRRFIGEAVPAVISAFKKVWEVITLIPNALGEIIARFITFDHSVFDTVEGIFHLGRALGFSENTMFKVTDAIHNATLAWQPFVRRIIEVVKKIPGLVKGFLDIGRGLDTWQEVMAAYANAAWRWIVDTAIPVASAKISEWISVLVGFVKEKFPIWRDTLFSWATAAWRWISDVAIPVASAKISKWTSNLINFLGEKLPIWKATLMEWANTAWRWIVDVAAPMAISKIGEFVKAMGSAIVNHGPTIWAAFINWTASAWAWILKAEVSVIRFLTGFINTATDWVRGDGFGRMHSSFGTFTEAALDWISGETMNPLIKSALINLGRIYQENIPVLREALADMFRALGKLVWFSFQDALFGWFRLQRDTFIGFWREVGQLMSGTLTDELQANSPSKVFRKIGADVMMGLQQGLESMNPQIAIQGVAGDLIGGFSGQNLQLAGAGAAGINSTNNISIPVNISVNGNADADRIGSATQMGIREALHMAGVA